MARFTAMMLLTLLLGACVTTTNKRSTVDLIKASETNVRLASGYLSEGKTEIAFDKATRAVQQNPDNASAHSILAIIYEQLEQSEQAETQYRKALALEPENGDLQNNFGTFLCQHGQYDAAQQSFEKAINNPFYASPEVALTNAGACSRRNGDNVNAERLFREAIALNANYPEALFHLAIINYENDDFFRARAFLQRYEAVGGDVPESLLLGYRVENGLGDVEMAGEYRERMMSRFPESREARMMEESNPDDK